MTPRIKSSFCRSIGFIAIALPLLVAGCADGLTPPNLEEEEPGSGQQVALLTCHASVQEGSVDCGPATPQPRDGLALDQSIVGGQGIYVRLTSSNVSYAAELFAFNVTVQNLTSTPLATSDGVTRDAQGVRVFFQEAPTATVGSGSIDVLNATGVGTFTAGVQPFFQYGGAVGGIDQNELGVDGILESGETSSAKSWQLHVPPTVETFTFTLLVATEVPNETLESIAPQVSEITPATLQPGTVAVITGTGFDPIPGNNVVTIGGKVATVTAATISLLEVMVPCVVGGSVPVTVSTNGLTGASLTHSLDVPSYAVPVGELVVIDPSDVTCSQVESADGPAHYVLSVFSNSTAPASNSPFRVQSDLTDIPDGQEIAAQSSQRLATSPLSLHEYAGIAQQNRAIEMHEHLIEQNRRTLEEFRPSFGSRGQIGARRNVIAMDVSPNRTFRIPNISTAEYCRFHYVVSATRVYYDGKIAIYEDDALADPFKAANSATMALNYDRIGDQFNEDMEPIIREYFEDILKFDAELDDNGVVIVLVTPRINQSWPGTAGFVSTCDLLPNDDVSSPGVGGPYAGSVGSVNGSSNEGEIIYLQAPSVNDIGYGTNTPDNWYRQIRSTLIHEAKHLASFIARIDNGAAVYEETWLEEGTARHAEELWGRIAVDDLDWKGNTGYGSALNPVNSYCDLRPDSAWVECNSNPRRPAWIMQRIYGSLYTVLFGTNARLLSPFGATASDNAGYYYQMAWSLIRYAVDRYAEDEALFFQALNQSTSTGINNLLAVADTDMDTLLGGWSLSLGVDDHPNWESSPNDDVQIQTWNLRDIYNGMNSDFPGTYSMAYPSKPASITFGDFPAQTQSTLRGGGYILYEFDGVQSAPQILSLLSNTGASPSESLRMAITRIK